MKTTHLRRVTALSAVVFAIGAATTAQAAFDVYLEIPGIPGEEPNNDYRNTISVQSHEVIQGVSGASGKKGESAGACVQEITITKRVDLATGPLGQLAASGTPAASANLIHAVTGGAEGSFEFLRMALTDVRVIGQTFAGSDGDDFVEETLILKVGSLEGTYTQQNQTGGAGTMKSYTMAGC